MLGQQRAAAESASGRCEFWGGYAMGYGVLGGAPGGGRIQTSELGSMEALCCRKVVYMGVPLRLEK